MHSCKICHKLQDRFFYHEIREYHLLLLEEGEQVKCNIYANYYDLQIGGWVSG